VECSLVPMSGISGGDRQRGLSVPALVATALLAHDLPGSTVDEQTLAANYVDDSVAAMPDVTRAGVRMASAAVYVALSVMARAPYRRVDRQQQSQLAAKLAGVPLPILGEFSRLTRGLGLVGVYEHRNRELVE